MSLNLASYKLALNELSSATKFDALVQAVQDAANNMGDPAYGAFAAGKIFDPTKIKQGGASNGQVIMWNGSIWTPTTPPGSALTMISDTTLGADAAVDITSIPATSKHLMLVCYLRTAKVATTDDLSFLVNNDSAANYDSYSITAAGTAPTMTGQETLGGTNMTVKGLLVGASATANVFGAVVIWIPHYANTTNNKTLHFLSARKVGTTTGLVATIMANGNWRSNSAINRLTLTGAGGSFKSGSRVTLYGL